MREGVARPFGVTVEAKRQFAALQSAGLRYRGRVSGNLPCDGERVGHFHVVRKLGEGGMGAVFEAKDEKLGRRVALKLLPPEVVGSPERRMRFLREARAAAAVQDRTIATVYEVGEDGSHVYIAMEYVRGENLRERLSRAQLPVAETLRIATDVARALTKAHAAGFVHRDLKPDNVMLNEDGEVKLLDFGIAKPVDKGGTVSGEAATAAPATREGQLIGTPGYLSPEQARGEAVDQRSDLFSFGCVFYELLTGKPAFCGATLPQLLVATLEQEPSPIAEARPDGSAEVQAIVSACLEKDLTRRVQTARELLERLEAAAERLREGGSGEQLGRALSAGSHDARAHAATISVDVRSAEPTPVRSRTRKLIAGACAAVVATGAAFGVWRWRAGDAQQPKLPPGAVLGAQDVVIGCPVLDARGEKLDPGWLGAAASSLLCTDLSLVLGVDDARTRIPAELLGLPKTATDDFPSAPFQRPEARQRSLEAAAKLSAWVDGRVEKREGGFWLTAQLKTPTGAVGDEIKAHDKLLHRAVFAVVDSWLKSGALSTRAPVSDWMAVTGCETMACRRAAVFGGEVKRTSVDEEAACSALRQAGGNAPLLLSQVCGPKEMPAVDDSDPMRVALRALTGLERQSKTEGAALAGALARSRPRELRSTRARVLLMTEAALRGKHGQLAQMRSLADLAEKAWPRDCQMRSTAAALTTESVRRTAGAYAAWCPWQAEAHSIRMWFEKDPLSYLHLAFALSGETPRSAVALAYDLLRAGRPLEARSLGSRLVTGSAPERAYGDYILALVEADSGHLAAATRRLRESVWRQKALGDIGVRTLLSASLFAAVLGTEGELAEAFIRDFLLVDPPRLDHGVRHFAVVRVAMAAPRPVALQGLARLRKLFADGVVFGDQAEFEPLLEGAERYVRKDFRGAVKHWRPLVQAQQQLFVLRPEAFDRADEPELASKLDQLRIQRSPRLELAHVREALRAEKRGETNRARELATRVVDTWSTADAELVHVKDMRALLARLPKAPGPAGDLRNGGVADGAGGNGKP